MKSLLLFCYPNYSDLLKALNSVSDANQIIETGATHRGQFVLLIEGEATDALRTNATDFSTVAQLHTQFLPAYFKQRPVRAEKNLVCVEAEKLSSLFDAVQTVLSKSNFQCIEINRAVNEKGQAVALFANGDNLSVFDSLAWVQVTKIENPSATIKKYF